MYMHYTYIVFMHAKDIIILLPMIRDTVTVNTLAMMIAGLLFPSLLDEATSTSL